MVLQRVKFTSQVHIDFKLHLFYAFFIRFFVIMYGLHHDSKHRVKFTDVDYFVFSDATRQVFHGESPFNRPTYRYSPLLAWILLPNEYCSHLFGKVLFALLDCVAAQLIHQILMYEGHSGATCSRYAFLWLYNPLVIAISARGSSDSTMAALVLLMVYFLKHRLPILTGMFLGLSIHVKIYPIIYVLPIYLSFTKIYRHASVWEKLCPNKPKVKFLISSGIGFMVPTIICYALYGQRYLDESFLYHIDRVDTRHNFSVYFYLMYLCEMCHPVVLKLCTFVPQMVLVACCGWKYSSPSDLNFGLFLQTFAFVMYNKVVTSQYFIWFLLLLPVVAPKLNVSKWKIIFLVAVWIFAQGSWLLPAYLLEFKAIDTFFAIWLESVAFLSCNVGIMIALVKSYAASKKLCTDEISIRKNR